MTSLPRLYELSPSIKKALLAFLILQLAGVLFGLSTLFVSTELSISGTATHYRGDPLPEDDFEIQEHFEKPLAEMLLTTHNHLLGFSFIFALLVPIFFLSSLITGSLKTFIMVEPFISVLVTFLSIWGLRYISPHFVYITMVFGFLTYATYFFMVGVIVYELAVQKNG